MRLAASHAVRSCTPRSRNAGFTLVELLVVIGIIALLISIILPSLRKAKMAAQRAQCLSNMRQITLGCIMWTNDHHGYMVDRSGSTLAGVDSNGKPTGSSATKNPITNSITDTSSWIAWQRVTDLATGIQYTGNDDENISYSAIAQYMGQKPVMTSYNGTGGLPLSAQFAGGLERVFQCPGDNIADRPTQTGTTKFYRFSYSMNDLVSWTSSNKSYSGGIPAVNYPAGQRSDFQFNGKLASIMHPQSVLMFVCEDEQTLDDGIYLGKPESWVTAGQITSFVASRHDVGYKGALANNLNKNAGKVDCQGNVSFVDGHAGILSRKDAMRQKYTSSPAADPAGF